MWGLRQIALAGVPLCSLSQHCAAHHRLDAASRGPSGHSSHTWRTAAEASAGTGRLADAPGVWGGIEGSGQFRVKMYAKLEVAIFQCIRDTKILWFPGGVFDTFVGMS